MRDTGDGRPAPLFTLVAARAIAPVAGMPPNRGATILATPWATSSMFERWRPPIMPWATTAESRDSIPPSSAIVKAGAASTVTVSSVTWGKVGRGKPASMILNRPPIVPTRR